MALKREDFAATVGYQGTLAVVDRKVRGLMKKMTIAQALESGMYRAGFAAALYEAEKNGNKDVLIGVLGTLSKVFRRDLTEEDAKRLLGIQRVPAEINKVLLL
jgi:hypothetical protein